jgi:ribosomal protein S18 acetylase RimI-like enzyme
MRSLPWWSAWPAASRPASRARTWRRSLTWAIVESSTPERHDVPAIRPATAGDVEAVLFLWLAAGAHPTLTDTSAELVRLIDEQPGALLVAELEGWVAGSLIAAWDGWRANLYRLAVSPKLRRRGVAQALVADAGRRLRERGARRVSMLVVTDDKPALAFWDSLQRWDVLPDPSAKTRYVWNL